RSDGRALSPRPSPARSPGSGDRVSGRPGRAGGAVGARLLDERLDHVAVRIGLGVPLYAEHVGALGSLDRLGQLVEQRVAADDEAVADRIDPLVVVRLGD